MTANETTSILADIGGTNARFAIVKNNGVPSHVKIYAVREHPTMLGALKDYVMNECDGLAIQAIAMAIAGPVLGDRVPLTNSDWVCDKNEIKKALKTDHVFILNDFEAIAVAIGAIDSKDCIVLQAGQYSPRHPRIVLGPGTGLGVAALKPTKNGFEAITTEAGHVRFAPANDREHQLIRLLSRKLSFVSAEDLLAGPGLVNLYNANCMHVGDEPVLTSPADIVETARSGNPLCRQVLNDFAAMLGSFASQVALTYNALGGVYLAGGVLQKIGQDFDQSRFLERFNTNTKMSGLLSRMPVMKVQIDIPAFDGLKATIDATLHTQQTIVP